METLPFRRATRRVKSFDSALFNLVLALVLNFDTSSFIN